MDRIRVALLVRGASLDEEWISAQLGVPRSPRPFKDEPDRLQRRHETWVFRDVGRPDESLERCIETLLSRITADHAAWDRVTQRYKVTLACGLFLSGENEMVDLSSGLLSRLASLSLSLWFDIYALGVTAEQIRLEQARLEDDLQRIQEGDLTDKYEPKRRAD